MFPLHYQQYNPASQHMDRHFRCLLCKWMNDKRYSENKFTPLEVSKMIAACKLIAPHFAFDVYKHVMIWLGAYGYTKECPLEMGLRGIMSYCIGAEGSTNIQRVIIARELLGKEFVAYK